jgi:hypothetical protein
MQLVFLAAGSLLKKLTKVLNLLRQKPHGPPQLIIGEHRVLPVVPFLVHLCLICGLILLLPRRRHLQLLRIRPRI